MRFKYLLVLVTLNCLASTEAINQLDERLTDLELKLSETRLHTNLELQMFGGYLKNDNALASNKKLGQQVYRNNLRIKIQGKLSQEFSAYTSLQVSHSFNDEVQSGIVTENDILIPTHGSRPYLRTAYFDWKLHNNFILSAGRLPTTFGPPEHQKAGRSRLGTYPLTSFNFPIDGISVTNPILSNSSINLTARTIYMPGPFTEPASPQNGISLSSREPNRLAKGHTGFTQMIDIDFKKPTAFYEKSNFIFQYTYLDMGSFVEQTTPLPLISKQDPNQVDRNIYRIYADDDKLAKLQILSGYIDLIGVLNSKFDLYASYMHSWNKPLANIKAEVISDSTGGGMGSVGSKIDLGKFLAKNKAHGSRSILGLKYNFENSFLGNEFWKTSGLPIPNDLYSDDPIALGQLSGDAIHVYYTHLFYNRALSVRTGYIDINTDKRFESFAYVDRKQNISLAYTSIFLTY